MLTKQEQEIGKLIDSDASHDNHYLVSNSRVRLLLLTIQQLREEQRQSAEYAEQQVTKLGDALAEFKKQWFQLQQENEQLRDERDRVQSTLMEVESAKIKTHNQWWALTQENERLRNALEDIAFGRVEGDYSDARQYASEALEEKE
jgi:DNA repair ATPase RecN